MIDAARTLLSLGGVAHAATLRRHGVGQKVLERAVLTRELSRIRSGWYCLPGNESDTVRALRVGGRLDCVSVLRPLGIWLLPDERLHVAVARTRSRLRSPADRADALGSWRGHPSVVTHWRGALTNPEEATELVDDAAGRLATCLPRDHAIVAFDSLLNRQELSWDRLRFTLAAGPVSHEWMLGLVDAGCGSGLETLARLHLRAHRLRVRSQWLVEGVGWVDLLVGDRLIVELDSRLHHTDRASYEKDRARDLDLVARGYLVVRVTYRQVMESWATVEAAILAITRRGEHRWQGVHRRAGLDRPR